MIRCENILRSLGTKFKVVIDINFISKMGDKVCLGVIRHDQMWQDIRFEGVWVLNLKLSLTSTFYQAWGIKCDRV